MCRVVNVNHLTLYFQTEPRESYTYVPGHLENKFLKSKNVQSEVLKLKNFELANTEFAQKLGNTVA
jgi:hypothetical protein